MTYELEVNKYIDKLVIKVIESRPNKDISFNDFKAIVLGFTTAEELDGYLTSVCGQGISIDHAWICADAFFQLRWASLLIYVDSIPS